MLFLLVNRNIEGPALLPSQSLDKYATFSARNTTAANVNYALMRIRCPPDHKSLGDIIALDQLVDEEIDSMMPPLLLNRSKYGCVHNAFLARAKLGGDVW